MNSDRLHSSATNGATMSLHSFNSRVGSGSLAHCLSESCWMTRVSSSTVSGRISDCWSYSGTDVNDDDGALVVEALTPATFASKNW